MATIASISGRRRELRHIEMRCTNTSRVLQSFATLEEHLHSDINKVSNDCDKLLTTSAEQPEKAPSLMRISIVLMVGMTTLSTLLFSEIILTMEKAILSILSGECNLRLLQYESRLLADTFDVVSVNPPTDMASPDSTEWKYRSDCSRQHTMGYTWLG